MNAPRSAIPCLTGTTATLVGLPFGQVSAEAGRGAVECLETAIDLALARRIDGIVTMPLHKEGIHAAGYPHPGHTEILAERTAAPSHAMVLYRRGLAVAHVTLHQSLRSVFADLTTERIVDRVKLLAELLPRLGIVRPRLAVAALNPHASDGGLFGDEERTIIGPAVERARTLGHDVTGPLPADTLFARAMAGGFDGVVALYHDQGHIALKVAGWREAVNITAGLPIVRTSVAHGTAYDLAGQGRADLASFVEAVDVAAKLCGS
jgi:4-hydroxythreonine-4-phosphate dehydrogenase